MPHRNALRTGRILFLILLHPGALSYCSLLLIFRYNTYSDPDVTRLTGRFFYMMEDS